MKPSNTVAKANNVANGATAAATQNRPSLLTFATETNAVSASYNNQASSPPFQQKNQALLATLKKIKQLNRQSDVEYAEPNYRVSAFRTPNDPLYPIQWHYPQINLPQAWDITTGTPATGNVIVAIVDTGVVLDHDDLAGQLVSGYDFIRSTTASNDGNGIDNDPNDPGDGDGSVPDSWHGTHVAGTVAAASNNNRGVSGVAWGQSLCLSGCWAKVVVAAMTSSKGFAMLPASVTIVILCQHKQPASLT